MLEKQIIYRLYGTEFKYMVPSEIGNKIVSIVDEQDNELGIYVEVKNDEEYLLRVYSDKNNSKCITCHDFMELKRLVWKYAEIEYDKRIKVKRVYKEKLNMKYKVHNGKNVGYLQLMHLPIYSSVKIKVLDTEIYPMYFDDFGYPIFDAELAHSVRRKLIQRTCLGEIYDNSIEVTYLRDTLEDIDYFSIKDINEISEKLKDKAELRKLIQQRKKYYRVYPNRFLKEYVIYGGKYLLDRKGDLLLIYDLKCDKQPTEEIMKLEDFVSCTNGFKTKVIDILPEDEQCCVFCKQTNTINDIRNGNVSRLSNGKIVHYTCLEKHNLEIQKRNIIDNIIKQVYENITYEVLLGNERKYLGTDKTTHCFLVKTEDGEFTIRAYKKKVIIIFNENFKKFKVTYTDSSGVHKLEESRIKINSSRAVEILRKIKEYK